MSEQFEKARKAAYRLLAHRARTEREIAGKLMQKGFDADTVRLVINNLQEYRMLDDRAYAESFVAGRRPGPRAAMSWELRKRGVAESIIESVLEGADNEAEFRIALAQAMSRIKKYGEDDYSLASLASYLRRRGFNQDAVDRVCGYLHDKRQPRDLDS